MEVQHTGRTTHIIPVQTHLQRIKRDSEVSFEVLQIDDRKGYAPVISHWEEVPSGGPYPPPQFRLSGDEAQRLVDQLYDMGIRPTAEFRSAGQLGAVQKHLEDMRAIAFNAVDVVKP